MQAQRLRQAIIASGDAQRAVQTARFFKTGPGQYGEGDIFCGVSTPIIRSLVKQNRDLSLEQVLSLLRDPVHEVRACAVILLVTLFDRGTEEMREQVVTAYVREARWINNWDLVDISCGILGKWLLDKERSLLYHLADAATMWEQRMAVVGTLPLIKAGQYEDTLALVKLLHAHPHDLMHKAMGWMLREVGKKDKTVLLKFLDSHVHAVSRTTLRYAIERFSAEERQYWLKK